MSTPTPTGNPGAILPGLPALSSCKVQNAGFEKADKDIADLINGLVSVRRDVEELKDYVRNGFTETNSRLGALEKDVAELKGDVAELKGDVAEIKGGMHKVLAALQMLQRPTTTYSNASGDNVFAEDRYCNIFPVYIRKKIQR